MSWFKNMSTMKKLGAGFGLMGALLVVIAALGMSTASGANAAFDTAFHRDMKGIELVENVRYDVVFMARTYVYGALSPDPKIKEETLRQLDTIEHDANADLDALDRTIVVEDNRQRIADAKSDVAEYAKLGRECIRLSTTDIGKSFDVLKVSAPLGARIRAAVDGVLKTKEGLAQAAYDQSQSDFARSRLTSVVALVVALLVALSSVVIIGRAIARPLASAVLMLERVAAGDLTAELEVDSEDEVGPMARALNAAVAGMRTALTEVRAVANEVASASQQLSGAAEDISGGAQKQASSLEETAASLEEIASTVKQNADNAQQAAQLASGSRDVAEKGGASWSRPFARWARSARPPSASATSPARSTRSRSRPTCSRSTRPSRRPALASRDAASPWWPPRYAASRSVAAPPPRRSAASSATRS